MGCGWVGLGFGSVVVLTYFWRSIGDGGVRLRGPEFDLWLVVITGKGSHRRR